jgi:hypothetical protein
VSSGIRTIGSRMSFKRMGQLFGTSVVCVPEQITFMDTDLTDQEIAWELNL